MKVKLLLLIFLIGLSSFAQDLDIYKHQKNSNFDIPDIPKNMTYEEFKILSTDLRMQDMAIAAILPGHTHFKIGDNQTGYYLLSARLAGYLGWAYLSLSDKSLSGILVKDRLNVDADISTADTAIAYSSVALMLGSYLYDWIHGKYRLDAKQSAIRYKYAKKKFRFGLSIIPYNYKMTPSIALTYKF